MIDQNKQKSIGQTLHIKTLRAQPLSLSKTLQSPQMKPRKSVKRH
jgi:hypothetical protein